MAATLHADVWNSSSTAGSLVGEVVPSLESLPLFKIRNNVLIYGAPPVLLLGNFGNVMTIIIMRRMASGESAVNVYFTAMAVIDLIILDIYLLGDWIGITFSFWIKYFSNPSCKMYSWISTGSTTISAWFLVCMTVHRAMSVVWPHRVNLLCTRRKVIMLLGGIATFYAAVYSHNLYGYGLVYKNNRYYCDMLSKNYLAFIQEVFTYIDLVFYCLLPFTCLFIANGLLVWKLRANVRETRHKFAQGRSDQAEARQKTARSVTLTIVIVSAAFIVLTLPSSLFYAISFVTALTNSATVYDIAGFYLTHAVTSLLMFSNNAVNFYLYCLTGKRFREEFLRVVCCGLAVKPPGGLPASE